MICARCAQPIEKGQLYQEARRFKYTESESSCKRVPRRQVRRWPGGRSVDCRPYAIRPGACRKPRQQ